MEDKTNSKFNSRKFIVWLTATCLYVSFIAYAFVTGDSSVAREFTPWWGGITVTYLGANAVQKFATPTTPGEK